MTLEPVDVLFYLPVCSPGITGSPLPFYRRCSRQLQHQHKGCEAHLPPARLHIPRKYPDKNTRLFPSNGKNVVFMPTFPSLAHTREKRVLGTREMLCRMLAHADISVCTNKRILARHHPST